MVKDKATLDSLQHPCSVFITMENEEGLNRAKMYTKAINGTLTPNENKDGIYDHVKEYGPFLGEYIDI